LKNLNFKLKEEVIKNVHLRAINNISFLKDNFSKPFLEKLSAKLNENW
jgi:hypothetical protein